MTTRLRATVTRGQDTTELGARGTVVSRAQWFVTIDGAGLPFTVEQTFRSRDEAVAAATRLGATEFPTVDNRSTR
jgi:hypothetical protein